MKSVVRSIMVTSAIALLTLLTILPVWAAARPPTGAIAAVDYQLVAEPGESTDPLPGQPDLVGSRDCWQGRRRCRLRWLLGLRRCDGGTGLRGRLRGLA